MTPCVKGRLSVPGAPVNRFLARLDEVQEELLYYPWRRRWCWRWLWRRRQR